MSTEIRVAYLRRAFAAKVGIALYATVLLTLSPTAEAQGCAQCLDTTRATPPAVQAAYRHSIYLLAGVAATLFLGGTLLLRRNP